MVFEKCISYLYWPITVFIIACAIVTAGLALGKKHDYTYWIVAISVTGAVFTLIQAYISDRLMRKTVKILKDNLEIADSKIARLDTAVTTADNRIAALNTALTTADRRIAVSSNDATTRIVGLDTAVTAMIAKDTGFLNWLRLNWAP